MKNPPYHPIEPIRDLREMLDASCSRHAPKAAFLVKKDDRYRPISFGQFQRDVRGLGTALTDLEHRGERIAVLGENRYEWAVSYLAAVNGTGVVVPIDKELPEHEIESLLARSDARAIVYSGKFEPAMERIALHAPGIRHFIGMDAAASSGDGRFLSFRRLLEAGTGLLDGGDRRFLDSSIDPERMSLMLFTSGTTAQSKAVMLSHRNLCANLMDMGSMLYVDENDVFLSFLPLHHTYECTCGFLFPLYRGSAIAYCEGLRHLAKNFKESGATVMLSVPLVYESMYKRIWEQAAKKPGQALKLKAALKVSRFLLSALGVDLRRRLFGPIREAFGGRMRLWISGAAPLDPTVARGFRDFGIFLIQGYGLTECSPILTVNREAVFRDSAAGLPLPTVEIRIEDAGPDGVGEIVARGPNVMLGYYRDEEATARVLRDGWFYTGDLGCIDRDGFVHITGRKKDVIVTKNGKKIFPEELEILLNRSPCIRESMVWAKPDSEGGVIVSAVIVVDMESLQEKHASPCDEGELRSLIAHEVKATNRRLPRYKQIREFSLREDELIKTTTRKIIRYLEKGK